jgi:hypothetical protein
VAILERRKRAGMTAYLIPRYWSMGAWVVARGCWMPWNVVPRAGTETEGVEVEDEAMLRREEEGGVRVRLAVQQGREGYMCAQSGIPPAGSRRGREGGAGGAEMLWA